jgi:glycosyltransferase involved in cell wall biosynthesis
VEEVMAEMAGSHIFVMPTLADTFGFVYLEAMASACAIIGPDRQPQTWILDGGRAGMMVNPDSDETLAGAIAALVTNRQLRTNIALAGWRRYHNTFAAPVVAAQYQGLFEEAIELHHCGNPVTCGSPMLSRV